MVLRDGVHDSSHLCRLYRRRFSDAGNVLVLGSIDDGMGSRHHGGHALRRSDRANLRR